MNLSIDIPQEIAARLTADARASGVNPSDVVRDFLIEHYADEEGRQIAEARLDDPQTPISSMQLRKNLGLDR